jgi:hypothetical protein
MGSWIRCKCGNSVHKNLFCGTGISLIVTEDFLDADRADMSSEDFISELISASEMQLKCSNCGRMIFVRETKEEIDVRFYVRDENGS